MGVLEIMYNRGYKEALEDIRDVIDDMLHDIPEEDETRQSFYTGMQVALHNIAAKTYDMKGNI